MVDSMYTEYKSGLTPTYSDESFDLMEVQLGDRKLKERYFRQAVAIKRRENCESE